MGIANKQFEGITTNIPGVYTKSEYPPNKGASGASTNIVAVIGSADSGVPYNASDVADEEKVNRIGSAALALDVLRGGPAYYMTEFYLTPTKDEALGKPTECLVFKVDPSVQASTTLQDVGTNDIIDLKSARYGSIGNQLARKIEAGTNLGHKVTVKFQGVTVAEEDDIGLEYMEIQYNGSGSAAAMSITDEQLTVTVTGETGDSLSLAFEDFKNLGDLVAYINEQANYTCTLLAASNTDTTTFDVVTDQDIKTSAYTALALVEALIQFFNLNTQNEYVASLHSGADRVDVTNDSNFIFQSGGSKGTATNTDWSACLALMEKFKINHILVASGDQAIAAMVDAHVIKMSSIEEKKNRSASSGAIAGLTLSARMAEAKVMNSSRMEYHITPFSRYDALNDNAQKEFDPFYGAALTAGIRFGNDVTISAVFKSINVLALSEKYSTVEKKQIISNGCSFFNYDEEFVVGHNLTTYQGQNLILNLPSMLRTCDAITLDSQSRVQSRLSSQRTAANEIIVNEMKNFLLTNLLPEYRDEKNWLTNDPITGDPAFSDIEFTLEGDAFYFSFTGIIPAPMHFVFIKQKFVVPGSTS